MTSSSTVGYNVQEAVLNSFLNAAQKKKMGLVLLEEPDASAQKISFKAPPRNLPDIVHLFHERVVIAGYQPKIRYTPICHKISEAWQQSKEISPEDLDELEKGNPSAVVGTDSSRCFGHITWWHPQRRETISMGYLSYLEVLAETYRFREQDLNRYLFFVELFQKLQKHPEQMPAVEPPPEYRPQPPIRHFHIIMASNIGTSQFSEGYAFPPISQKPLPCPDWQFLPHQQLEDDSQFEELLISLVGGPLRGYWLWKAYEQQPDESMHPVYRLNFLADPTTFPFIAIRTQTQQFLAYPFSPDLRPNQLVLEVLQLACQSKSNENHYYPIKITPRSFLLRPLQTIDSQQDSCAPLMQDLLNLGYVPISFEERKELLGSSSLNLEEKKENPDPSSFIKHLLQARKGSPVYQKTTPDGTVEYRIPIGSRERFYNIMHFWTNNLHPVLARCTKQFYKTPSPSPNETFSGLHFVPGTHGGFIPGVLSEPTDPASTAALSTSSSSSSATNPTPMEISLNSSEDWVVLYSPTTPYSAREDCPPQENEIIRLTTMRTRGNLSSATIEFQRSSQSYQITVPRGEVATVRKVLLKHTESLEEIQRSNVSIFQLHFH